MRALSPTSSRLLCLFSPSTPPPIGWIVLKWRVLSNKRLLLDPLANDRPRPLLLSSMGVMSGQQLAKIAKLLGRGFRISGLGV
jgi:hypothetical protein